LVVGSKFSSPANAVFATSATRKNPKSDLIVDSLVVLVVVAKNTTFVRNAKGNETSAKIDPF
jgi:hypothetical protein